MPFHSAPTDGCPICHTVAQFQFKRDHQNDSGTFSLYECSSCQVQFWLPLKAGTAEWYQKTYASEYAVRGAIGSSVQRPYHRAALECLSDLTDGSRVADVACGTGEFLSVLEKRGVAGFGLDFNDEAIEQARRRYGIKHVYNTSVEAFVGEYAGTFDAVTCFEFIEHVEDPQTLLVNLKRLLKPGGRLLISTPSRERAFVNLNMWDFPPHHLTRWNESALIRLAGQIGLVHRATLFTDGFRFIFNGLGDLVRLRLAIKAAKHVRGPMQGFVTRIARSVERAKDLVLVGIPAFVVWVWTTTRKRKNGNMLIEFRV